MLSIEQGKKIAEAYAAEAVAYYTRKGHVFGEISLAYSHGDILTFVIPVPKLQEEGWAPGALIISVNQLSGEVVNKISIPSEAT